MAKDKTKPAKPMNGIKHELNDDFIPLEGPSERPAKKTKLLDDSDDDDAEDRGASLKVNEEYAKRFEHNKKREERQRLEEKYGKTGALAHDHEDEESEEDSEDDEEEDDEAELLDEDLDAQVNAALQAIRTKDPRIYSQEATFYRDPEAEPADSNKTKKEEAMTLKDYHTQNLLAGKFEVDDNEDAPPQTYAQEQEEARLNLLKQAQDGDASEEEEDDFLVARPKTQSEKRVEITEQDVANADKDPETFLSNFMAARAWVPSDKSHWKPLESDDSEEDAKAEDFETAYNMYFEDPNATNEKLVTYARDTVAKTSVRREEPSARHKAREAARRKREAERREREEEMARLRKLKIEEMEEKLELIKKTAGLTGRNFKMEEWADVLEADWSDDQWEKEMQKRFGEAYYEAADGTTREEDEEEGKEKGKKKVKKPRWDEDVDIKDLIPDFDDEEMSKPTIALSDDEDEEMGGVGVEDEDETEAQSSSKKLKHRKQERAEAKREARKDRRMIEALVDSKLEADLALASNSKAPTKFRYRETSPTTFGLTPRDILLATDSQLNQFAGLKKLATFRDPDKKKKDKKHLSKKARLRQWRAETFGDEEGPKGGFELLLGEEDGAAEGHRARDDVEGGGVNIREGDDKKRKKRSKKRKAGAVEA